MSVATGKSLRILCIGTASCLAISVALVGETQAQTPDALPEVTVDAPRAPASRRTNPQRRATTARGPIRAAAVRASRREPVRQAAVAPQGPISFAAPPTSTLGAPPPPYAGGQVATGAQLGLLGNRGTLETPFNQTSFTAQLIQDQQARTVGDVLQNDPSVRNVTPAGSGIQGFFIRGFYYDSGDLALNGLYGIAPYYSTGANFLERVEVLKGPSTLLTGVPPAGAVGGSINLVTKKAPDFDVTQMTPYFISKGQFGTLVDVARRYGEAKEWGIRFNGEIRDGRTEFGRQNETYGNAVFGLDYRGENVRVSADFGYQGQTIDQPIRFLSFLPSITPIPPAPKAGTNYIVPWATLQPQDKFTTIRGEVDLTDWATAYAAIGYRDSIVKFAYPSPTVTNFAGDYLARPFFGDPTIRTLSGEVGLRTRFDTGPVSHSLNFNASGTNQETDNLFKASPSAISSNIFNPRFVPEQFPSTTVLSQRLGTQITSYGVADTLSILDRRVQFTAGVRNQSVESDSLNRLTNVRTKADGSVLSPAFALLVRATDNLSLYANYIEGLQPGQTVGVGFANSGQTFAPFQTKQAEVGAKLDTGRFSTTVSFFQITQPSLITIAALPLSSQRVDGEQRNSGAEINLFGEIVPGLRVLGGVALIDGKLTRTQGGTNDGNRAPGVATVNFNLGAEVDIPYLSGLTLTGHVIHTSQEFVNPANTQRLPEWTRVDLGARYTFLSPFNGKPIIVRASVENVADKSYYASAYNGVVTVGAPRTYLLSTTFNF